jgi:predicted ATPase
VEYLGLAGHQAVQRSANEEAVQHFTTAIDRLQTLPDSAERRQHELALQVALGVPLTTTKSWATPEVEKVYLRARELCEQVGDTPELFPVLYGLFTLYGVRAEHQQAHEVAEQLLRLAQSRQDPALLIVAHFAWGGVLYFRGELVLARTHWEQTLTLYDAQQHHALTFRYGSYDPGVICLCFAAGVLWQLGYPEQALKRSHEALSLAQDLSHPFSLAFALNLTARFHQLRREGPVVQERAEAAIALSSEQGFPFHLEWGTILQGWVLAEQGQGKESVSQLREGLAAYEATGSGLWRPYFLALLAEVLGKVEQAEEGLRVLNEALMIVERTEERFHEAELHRLKGELTLGAGGWRLETSSPSTQSPSLKPQASGGVVREAEECFLKAIEIAQKQHAKSLELRTATSLARLWQQQGKTSEAHELLAPVYNWFTEGFDTKDLQEAKALLDELS